MTTVTTEPVPSNTDRAIQVINAINERNRPILTDLTDEQMTGHALGADATRHGREQWLDRFFEFIDAFPDLTLEIKDVIAEHDRVMCRVQMTGTFTEPFDGLAPSGNTASVAGFHVFRFENNMIVEWWRLNNMLGWARQLDAIPTGPRSFFRIIFRQLTWKLRG